MDVRFKFFVDGELYAEEIHQIDERDLEALSTLAEEHALRMVAHDVWLIEVELLDLTMPDRFFRFGTDTTLMVTPLGEFSSESIQQHPWSE